MGGIWAIRQAAQAVALACALMMCFWLLYSGTRVYLLRSAYLEPGVYGSIPACTAHGSDALSPVFNTCQEERTLFSHILFMWLIPSLLALSSLVMVATTAHLRAPADGRGPTWWRLSRLAPARRFWLQWCGGLTTGHLLVIALWLLMNAMWLYAIISRNQALQVIKLAKRGWPHTPATKAKLLGKSMGMLLYPNLVLLFTPVARGSVVLQAAGISYGTAIKFHRWLGHAVLWIVTVHALLYYAAWLHEGHFVSEVLEREPNVNKLFGTVSGLFGLLLWLSSLEFVRRRHYAGFKALHHIGFWGFLLFGAAHSWSLVWYTLPGLLLYAVDAVYRLTQATSNSTSNGSVKLLHSQGSLEAGVCSLVIDAPDYAVPSSGCVWLCVPDISWTQWHPFTFIAVPWGISKPSTPSCSAAGNQQLSTTTTGTTTTAMLVQVKAYNRWSRRLVEMVCQGQIFTLKVQGPYADKPEAATQAPKHQASGAAASSPTKSASKYPAGIVHAPSGVIIVAGGLGIAPAMSILQDLERAAATAPVLFIWSCRKAAELEYLAPPVLAMLESLPDFLVTTKLFLTGGLQGAPAATATCSHSTTAAADNSPPITPSPMAAAASSGNVAPAGTEGKSTRVVTNLSPVVNWGGCWGQVCLQFLLHALVFAGAFAGITLARYLTAVRPRMPMPTAKTGFLYVVILSALSVIPGLLLLQLCLLWQRKQRWAAAPVCQKNAAAAPQTAADAKTSHACAPANTSAGAAAAAATLSGTAATGKVAGGVVSLLPEAISGHMCSSLAGGFKSSPAPAAAVGEVGQLCLQLWSPDGMHHAAVKLPVAAGRPPLRQLVQAWLAGLQQLPVAVDSSRQQGGVKEYAMGPEPLVLDVQLLCDDLNASRGSGCCFRCPKQGAGSQHPLVHFVRKSYDL